MATNRVTATVRTDAVRKQVHAAAANGLLLAAEHLLQVSRTKVPIDTAALERSGVATVNDEALRAAVSYDTPYAVAQHETAAYKHTGGRTWKYLEGPFNDETDAMAAIISHAVQKATR